MSSTPGAHAAPPRPPPHAYSGAASLYEHLDKLILVCLRDGRTILGTLRSFDQYGNLVLDSAAERIVIDAVFGDVPIGIFVVRGENVMILAEIDPAKEQLVTAKLQQVTAEEIQRAHKAKKMEEEAVRRRERLEWPIHDEFF